MKIQVTVEGDCFDFSADRDQLPELINAAIQVVYGDEDATFSLVDCMDMPATTLRHLQRYTVVKRPAPGAKPGELRMKREGLFFDVRPKVYFSDESDRETYRSRASPGALKALAESTGLSGETISRLFSGSESIRLEGGLASRREICIGVSGEFTWNFGDKCLGRGEIESVGVEGDCVVCVGRRFRLMSEEEVEAWRRIGQMDIEGFCYFLRTYEQCAIWRRWGDPSLSPAK